MLNDRSDTLPDPSPKNAAILPEGDASADRELEAQVGERLRKAREGRGLSQRQLAESMGYSAPMISGFETGQRRMKISDLAKACIVLNKAPDYFLGATPVPAQPVGLALRAELATLPANDLMNAVGRLLDEVERTLPIESAVPDLGHLQPDAAAQSVLTTLGIQDAHVEMDEICKGLGIPLYRKAFPDELSAVVFAVPNDSFVIGVNKSHHPNRRRFSIAHELGHAVMRHDCSYYLEYSVADAWQPPDYNYFDERDANGFAAALLMAEQGVRSDFAAGIRDVKTLATRYGVSQAAMGFRLTNLDLA